VRGRDREAGALRAATSNAARAGVAERIDLARAAVSALDLADLPPGWIVTNPPYGLRTGDPSSLERLYAAFGKVLRERAPRWRVLLLCPNARLGRAVGLSWRIGPWIHNGGVRVRVLEGVVGTRPLRPGRN
jgi:putative N6-adenine-specific DNA methylase